jgi:L,D-transpeptidase YcbB
MNGEATLHVDLEQPIPVLIVYGTAVALETGEVRFLDDLYGYDAELAKSLAKRSLPQ